MVSGQELFAERERIKKSLDNSLRRAYENGLEMAEMTRLYRIALHKEIMRQKAEGTPTTYLDKFMQQQANYFFAVNERTAEKEAIVCGKPKA